MVAEEEFHFFPRTFFRQAAVKQGEARDRSLRARRPTGVRQDIALQRRAGVRVANVGGELAEARSKRSLRCDCEHLPPPAPVRGCDSRALRRGAGESSALRNAVEEGLSLLAPSPSNFEGQHRQATPPKGTNVCSHKSVLVPWGIVPCAWARSIVRAVCPLRRHGEVSHSIVLKAPQVQRPKFSSGIPNCSSVRRARRAIL